MKTRKEIIMTLIQKLSVIVVLLLVSITLSAQAPNWVDPLGEYGNVMSAVFTVSDECVPSADPNDIVAAFDLAGNIRGVQRTTIENLAYMTIRSNGSGESIFFKVYDAGTDKVYNIYNYQVIFANDGDIGFDEPERLNFDSNPMGVDAGPDQEVFNMTSTALAAVGTGSWSIVEGVGGSFVNANSPTTVFNGLIATKYILAWTLDNAAGCIGETDEVIIYFVKNEPENGSRTCNDGLDNDGDGLYDCADPDCGQPKVTSVAKTEPTPIDCNTTQSDGGFTIMQVGADQFSLNMGLATQPTGSFSNLMAGNYDVWMNNSVTGCQSIAPIELLNTIDPLLTLPSMNVMGPEILCKGIQDINYSLDVPSTLGVLSWAYTGKGATISNAGGVASVDFSSTATAGGLIGKLTGVCASKSDTLAVSFAIDLLCKSNCEPNVIILPGNLLSENAPQVFRAGISLTTGASLVNYNYEFTAGESLNFGNGFSVGSGLNFIADIKNCSK